MPRPETTMPRSSTVPATGIRPGPLGRTGRACHRHCWLTLIGWIAAVACLITLWTRFGAAADDNFAGSDQARPCSTSTSTASPDRAAVRIPPAAVPGHCYICPPRGGCGRSVRRRSDNLLVMPVRVIVLNAGPVPEATIACCLQSILAGPWLMLGLTRWSRRCLRRCRHAAGARRELGRSDRRRRKAWTAGGTNSVT